jgi:sugar phosphate isomerase/epimerase
MWNVALSTMWGVKRFERLGDFFTEGQAAGFTRFELNHGVNSALLDGVYLNGTTITSVHEPCPADVSVAELKKRDWLISSTDEENRQRGVEAVRRSIDLARELGAPVVIVHPGRVNMDESLEAVLRQLYKEGKRETLEYEQAKSRMMDARAERASRHLQAVRRSLAELAEYAMRQGVRLGLENRDHYFEMPLLDEMDDLLSQGYGETVGYWHDIGHAEKSQYKGYGPHEAWLKRLSHKMIGVHLHDIAGMDDHLTAGCGDMDWELVARYLPDNILRTCEFQNASSPQQITDGLQWLAQQGLVSQI